MTELEITTRGVVEHWALSRPESRNALSPRLVSALHAALIRAEGSNTRVVVISGRGSGFCAGADLRYLYACARDGVTPRPFLESICDLTVGIEQSPVIFVAALNGDAVAGGLEIALACDLVLAAKGTRIGDGHVRHNLVPGGGSSARIRRLLGHGPGTWLALSGELTAVEALASSGWVHRVVPPEDLLPAAFDVAGQLASVPQAAQSRFKRLLNGPEGTIRAALTRELDIFDEHWANNDVSSHLRRFLSKTKEASHD